MTKLRGISISLIILLSIATTLWLQLETTSQVWVIVLFGSITPVLMLAGALRKIRNWGNLIALAMIFYTTAGIMDTIASLGEFSLAPLVAALSIGLFFTSIYAQRNEPG